MPDPAVTSSVPRKPPLHHDKPRRPARSCCPNAQRPVQPSAVLRQPRDLHVAGQIGDLIGNMQIPRLPLFNDCSNVVVIGRGGKTWLAAAACRDVAGASAATKL